MPRQFARLRDWASCEAKARVNMFCIAQQEVDAVISSLAVVFSAMMRRGAITTDGIAEVRRRVSDPDSFGDDLTPLRVKLRFRMVPDFAPVVEYLENGVGTLPARHVFLLIFFYIFLCFCLCIG